MTDEPLSPIDHIFTGVGSYPIEFVFAYDGTLDAGRLEDSFVEALSHFPAVCSKLERVSDHSFVFRPEDSGASFETTATALTFDDPAARYAFLDPVDSVEGEPLTKVKLTQTPRGSVLGVSMSHAVVDGFSYFFFLASWARLHSGKTILPPHHERGLLIPDRPARAGAVTPEDVLSECGVFWTERRESIARDQLHWDRLSLSEQEMGALLREAKEDCDTRLSYNDVIAAWLWKSYLSRWQSGADGGATYLSCPVDFRRIVRSLPRTYFGCAVMLATARLDYDALVEASIGQLAAKVRDVVAQVDENYVWRALGTLEALRRQEGLSVVEENHVIHPRDGILVTNLSRLPVFQLVFDVGPPAAFDILTPAPRGAVVLPASDGLDVRVCYPGGDGRPPSGG
jgi:shikimate O-hydroxycinnamoyltransferase